MAERETIVFQSFRTTGVPAWLARCMASVRAWAGSQGYAYRFVDDAIFDVLPDWYRLRTAHDMLLSTDLARLLVARDLLADYRRVVWVDADVLVFGDLALPDAHDFYVCREIWVGESGVPETRVNNCTLVFSAGTSFLPFWIDAAQALMRAAAGKLDSLMISTRFLTELDRVSPLPQLRTVGLFSPLVLRDVAAGEGPSLAAYRGVAGPLAAANLCLSFRGAIGDAVYERAVDALAAGLYSRA